MVRVILGLIKGAIVGGAVGFGLVKLGFTGGFFAYVGCALVGAVVGLVAGRAPWQAETNWTWIVKMIVGAIIGAGLCALGMHFLPSKSFTVSQLGVLPLQSGPVLAPLIGVLYGIFVEVDDGGAKKAPSAAPKGKDA